jgi:NAD(P)-dependent dehydrogenase (short-subunit alcohol dehydrogenase family)
VPDQRELRRARLGGYGNGGADLCGGGWSEAGEIERAIPLGRVASAAEIAGPIVFLCSEWARHITGEVFNVDGSSVRLSPEPR